MMTNTQNTHLWQRNYYEHVIRNEHDMLTITDYILTNPLNWEKDEEYQG
jgi:putative transposase